MFNIVFTRQLAGLHIFPIKPGLAWLRRTQTQHKSLILVETLFLIRWPEVRIALFLKMNFREQVSSVVHHRRWTKQKRLFSDLIWPCLPSWCKHNRSTIDFCQQEITLLRMCALRKLWHNMVSISEAVCAVAYWDHSYGSLLLCALKGSYHIFLFGFIYLCFPLRSTCISTKTGH